MKRRFILVGKNGSASRLKYGGGRRSASQNGMILAVNGLDAEWRRIQEECSRLLCMKEGRYMRFVGSEV